MITYYQTTPSSLLALYDTRKLSIFYFIFKKFHVRMAITSEISQIDSMITAKPQPLPEVA